MPSMREQRKALVDESERIARKAIDERRGFTTSEEARIEANLKAIHDLDADIAKAEESQGRLAAIARITTGDGTKRFLAPASKTAEALAYAMGKASTTSPTYGSKALLVAGDQYADQPMYPSDPVEASIPPTSLLDVLPVSTIATPTFSWLQETTRTNNAAPVATFGLKPTSVYGLTQRDGKLHVIAHVSEPFDEFWVQDAPGLQRFLEAEMVSGLRTALEAQVLNGDGIAPNLTGIAHTSGVQTQAYSVSAFQSARKGVTKAEALGYTPRFWIMNANDWEAMELSAFTGGQYILNATSGNLPVDTAARRLWGVPVVLVTAQVAGIAYLVSAGCVELVSDGRLLVQTSNATADDFTHNQLRMRVEGRYEVVVTSPAGIVNVDISA